ncbi:polycomb group protein EMBRYONIC FLOWER 2-like isoform X1 [Gossypium arboreum]|uniref:polycomb group protein EMBRYONIC FLOWER 2-like isoform X1 n=1 Tax=Gossypium arboreum TaxID=29729 RepID=UPI0022F1CF4E|nr:polycomb group protein EMBRYONIC FLOWER 2-like isoform X1 [Gossypium arboreum]
MEVMCRQNSCLHLSAEETDTAVENLLVYCKPVELYNILRCRASHNPSFLRRCLKYKIQARRKRRLRAGIVIFNYKDYGNMLQKTEVTEDFSCPFCLMQCASFKGLRYHLCSSHDLFNFDFWVTEEYQAVNVSVKIDSLVSETLANGVDPRVETFCFCSKPRRRRSTSPLQGVKNVSVQFLEMDSPKIVSENRQNGFLENDGERASKSVPLEKDLQNGYNGLENYGSDYASATECLAQVANSCDGPGVSIAMAHSPLDPDCIKTVSGTDIAAPPAKTRKIAVDRSEPRNRLLLLRRQFFHSHRVQPMEMDQVMSDRDSEDEVDDDIADLEDRRMLDDFVDVSKDEKQLMHLWNSFVRKQRVLADGHVSWACEAFSKLHGPDLVKSPALFWCWRLFMIKLWNHGLLDAGAMNNCSMILQRCQNEGSDAMKS